LSLRPITAAVATALVAGSLALSSSAAAAPPGQGPGGPILVVSDPGDPFGRYYAEILTAEGLNAFEVRDIGQVSAASLSAYSVVVLARTGLSPAQVAMFSNWVQSGGNLIAMRPDAALADLLGLGGDAGDVGGGYMRVNTGTAPGAGITGESMQSHGVADRWTLAGASTVADLYANASSPTGSPAVTLRGVGSAGGQAAAFTYDLARSIVYTRQGNPAWAGQKRDGQAGPIRSDDLFFGGAEPDWVDFGRIGIPQADEQQRLLANLVTQMSNDRLPMPRFWYFPRGERAVVVMTGDDHQANGTVPHFERFKQLSPAGCSVADWQCVRGTSYAYEVSAMSNAQVAGYQAQGFEIALHLNTSCSNFTAASLQTDWQSQLTGLQTQWPSMAAPNTNRTHCIAWSDWATQPKVERAFGIRLDTNYYYWPAAWIQDRPGMFTGSGMPMRFADLDGTPIDVYQATTQLTDESGQSIPAHVAALLDGALGPAGYYGAFTANMHTDTPVTGAEQIVAAAQARGVPVVSARQLLGWLDGRNESSFGGLSFDGSRLRFTLNHAGGARGLEAMVPAVGPGGRLQSLTRNGAPIAFSSRVVKGVEYAVFAAAQGEHVATYPAAPGTGKPLQVKKKARVKVRPRRVRASRRGIVKLKLACPSGVGICRVDLRLKRRGGTVARKVVRVKAGKTRTVPVKLKRKTRRRLAQARSLRVVAVAAARATAGSRATTKTRIRILAPRRRR
jgi:hypothetical protein